MAEGKIVIGIDLGTTYSAMAYVDESKSPKIIENLEGGRTTPSVVYFEENGNVIVGQQAKSDLVFEPMNGVELAKRYIGEISTQGEKRSWEIGDHCYSPEEISSFILKKLKKDASAKLGREITDAVITVPAYFDAAAREATRNAGQLAGFNVVALLNEPEAAAIAFTHEKLRQAETIFIYDLGGGTFDVTILKFDGKKREVLVTDGDHKLGGADLDIIVMSYLEEKALEDGIDINEDMEIVQAVKDEVEKQKKALSTKEKCKVRVERKKYEISREQYNELIKSKLDETEIIMKRLLTAAAEKGISSWQDIDRVILVGGSSYTPAVQGLVERVTGKKPDVGLNFDEAVALGAAIYADIYQGIEDDVQKEVDEGKITPVEATKKKLMRLEAEVVSVCSHSIGVIALNEKDKLENCFLIKKNTAIPCEGTYDFATAADNASGARIRVKLGESSDPDLCRDAGEAMLNLDGTLPRHSPIRVCLKYNLDGILEVVGEDLTKGHKIETTFDLCGQMSSEELAKRRQELAKINVE